jgi:peptidoglycan/xylan/chitin deacetylase (PgdA/CDA1 family)
MRATTRGFASLQRASGFAQWLRSRLTPAARSKVRALTDPLAGPLGSIRGVRTCARVVGLTFDDGPDEAYTSGILDVLSEYGATATWFVLVDRAEAHPELIARMLSDGHDVGLHGIDHSRLTRMPWQNIGPHIHKGVLRLSAVTGRPIQFFRPPYGAQSLSTFFAVRREGMESVVWSADCDDWTQHPEEHIADLAVAAASPGAILLLHDVLADSPPDPSYRLILDRRKIVELVLGGLTSRSFQSVSLSELLRLGDVHRTLWFRP